MINVNFEGKREKREKKKKRSVPTHHHIIDDTSTLYGKRHLESSNAAMKIIVWM
jgi:malonyl CoA-acyl carrier protein transacylase